MNEDTNFDAQEEYLDDNLNGDDTDTSPIPTNGCYQGEDGLYYGKTYLSGHIRVTAEYRNIGGNGWGKEVEIVDRDGNLKSLLIPATALAGTGSEVIALLLDRGLDMSRELGCRQRLLDYINGDDVDARIRTTDKTGWHEGNVYVLPEVAFGDTTETYRMVGDWAAGHLYKTQSTLDDWKTQIATPIVGNHRLMFAVSAAFAPPLLNLLGMENGGFHLMGISSTGKTTALIVSGSVWGGGGDKGYIRSWRSTDNGLEGVALGHNDALLVLDELGQMDPAKLGEATYMLSNGSAKVRASRTGESKPPATWRTLFLSNGELDLATHVQAARKTPTGGQEVRLVSIPSDAGKGLGVFDTIGEFPSAETFAMTLTERAKTFYGTPIRYFLAWLIQNLDKSTETARKTRDDFATSHAPPKASGEILRVARRFGLVAAAGELAIEAEVLPWVPGAASAAVAVCFKAWLDNREGTGARDETSAIGHIKRCIEQHGDARFPRFDDGDDDDGPKKRILRTFPNRLGFRLLHRDEPCYFFLPVQFKEEVIRGYNVRMVVKALSDRKLLYRNEGDRYTWRLRGVPDLGDVRGYLVRAAILDYEDG
jgi:uncharacterized protein (DUF927 family)